MAEFVEGRLQEMIPIWDKIKQTGLFTPKALTKWIGRIREAEMKIQRPARTTQDYFDYLNQMQVLLNDLTARREAKDYTHNKREIEGMLRGVILSRVGSAKHNFKSDPEFWEFIISFFKEMGWNDKVSNTYTEVLKLFGKMNYKVYIYASSFEWEKEPGRGIEQARELIQLGLREHPTELSLYVKAIENECLYTQYLKDAIEDTEARLDIIHGVVDAEDLIRDLPLIRSFYNNAKKQCKEAGVKLYSRVYLAMEPYEFAKDFMNEIFTEVKKTYAEDEATYHFLGKTALKEAHAQLNTSSLEKGIQFYEEGIQVKPTVKMFEYYTQTLQGLYEVSVEQRQFHKSVTEALLTAYTRAHNAKLITVDIYVSWYRLVSALEELSANGWRKKSFMKLSKKKAAEEPIEPVKLEIESSQILEFGLTFAPNSWELIGEKVMKLMLSKPDPNVKRLHCGEVRKKQIFDLFRQIRDPEGKSMAIWRAGYINFSIDNDIEILEVHKFILLAPPPVQVELSKLFIQECYLNFSAEIAMNFYKDMISRPGFNGNLHMEMAKQECLISLSIRKSKLEHVVNLHELSVEQFGNKDIEPWVSYMKFESEYRNEVGKVGRIYERAVKVLPPDLKEEFMKLYTCGMDEDES